MALPGRVWDRKKGGKRGRAGVKACWSLLTERRDGWKEGRKLCYKVIWVREGSAAGAQGVGQGVQSESSTHPLPGRAFVAPRLSEREKGLELQKGSGECNPAAPTPWKDARRVVPGALHLHLVPWSLASRGDAKLPSPLLPSMGQGAFLPSPGSRWSLDPVRHLRSARQSFSSVILSFIFIIQDVSGVEKF